MILREVARWLITYPGDEPVTMMQWCYVTCRFF